MLSSSDGGWLSRMPAAGLLLVSAQLGVPEGDSILDGLFSLTSFFSGPDGEQVLVLDDVGDFVARMVGADWFAALSGRDGGG